MIVIVGAVRVAVIGDLAGRVGERIPDRASAAVLVDGTLDLIRGSGGTPEKAFWERGRGGPGACPLGPFFPGVFVPRPLPQTGKNRKPWQKAHPGPIKHATFP